MERERKRKTKKNPKLNIKRKRSLYPLSSLSYPKKMVRDPKILDWNDHNFPKDVTLYIWSYVVSPPFTFKDVIRAKGVCLAWKDFFSGSKSDIIYTRLAFTEFESNLKQLWEDHEYGLKTESKFKNWLKNTKVNFFGLPAMSEMKLFCYISLEYNYCMGLYIFHVKGGDLSACGSSGKKGNRWEILQEHNKWFMLKSASCCHPIPMKNDKVKKYVNNTLGGKNGEYPDWKKESVFIVPPDHLRNILLDSGYLKCCSWKNKGFKKGDKIRHNGHNKEEKIPISFTSFIEIIEYNFHISRDRLIKNTCLPHSISRNEGYHFKDLLYDKVYKGCFYPIFFHDTMNPIMQNWSKNPPFHTTFQNLRDWMIVRTDNSRLSHDTDSDKDCEDTDSDKDCEDTDSDKDCEDTDNFKDCEDKVIYMGSDTEMEKKKKEEENRKKMENNISLGPHFSNVLKSFYKFIYPPRKTKSLDFLQKTLDTLSDYIESYTFGFFQNHTFLRDENIIDSKQRKKWMAILLGMEYDLLPCFKNLSASIIITKDLLNDNLNRVESASKKAKKDMVVQKMKIIEDIYCYVFNFPKLQSDIHNYHLNYIKRWFYNLYNDICGSTNNRTKTTIKDRERKLEDSSHLSIHKIGEDLYQACRKILSNVEILKKLVSKRNNKIPHKPNRLSNHMKKILYTMGGFGSLCSRKYAFEYDFKYTNPEYSGSTLHEEYESIESIKEKFDQDLLLLFDNNYNEYPDTVYRISDCDHFSEWNIDHDFDDVLRGVENSISYFRVSMDFRRKEEEEEEEEGEGEGEGKEKKMRKNKRKRDETNEKKNEKEIISKEKQLLSRLAFIQEETKRLASQNYYLGSFISEKKSKKN